MSEIDVSVIIVNYNTKQLLRDCINSIYTHTKELIIEIIVSDNGSVDGSISMLKELFPDVILLENNANLGFGKANNVAKRQARGKYIFYLNSDTVLRNNAIKYFFDYWEANKDKNIGALGANLLDSDNQYMHSFADFPSYKKMIFEPIKFFFTANIKSFLSIFFKNKVNKIKIHHDYNKYEGNVGYITGADLFLLNDEFSFFDERFFMYYEECDLELKLAKQGKDRVIIDGPLINHLENGSDKTKKGYSFSSIFNEISRIKYYKKNMKYHFFIPVIKFFVIATWLNPMIFKKAKSYFKEYLQA